MGQDMQQAHSALGWLCSWVLGGQLIVSPMLRTARLDFPCWWGCIRDLAANSFSVLSPLPSFSPLPLC